MLTWIALGGDLPWMASLYRWVAASLFGTEIRFVTGDSSDTTYDCGIIATHVVLAAAGTILWSMLGRKQAAYPRLFDVYSTALRVGLSTALLIYGFNKIYALQMPAPSLFKLSTPLGNLTPMELLWSFMGASPAYQMMAGWLEFIPGVLLLFRRTQLIGALLAAGVLLNVWLMNLCYGVCVKNISLHLLIIAVLIALPDASRLVRFFVWQQPVEPRSLTAPWKSAWLHRLLYGGRLLWLSCVFGFVFIFVPYQLGYFSAPAAANTELRRNPLQGRGFYGRIWEVAGFQVEGNQPLANQPWRLAKLQGESGFLLSVLPTAGKAQPFWALQPAPEVADGASLPAEGEMSVTSLTREEMHAIYRSTEETHLPPSIGKLRYRIEGSVENPTQVNFSGELLFDGQPTQVRFSLVPPSLKAKDFPLINTPFRWIQEYADASLN